MSGPLTPDAREIVFNEIVTRLDDAVKRLKAHPQSDADSAFHRGTVATLESLMAWVWPEVVNVAPKADPDHLRISEPPTGY